MESRLGEFIANFQQLHKYEKELQYIQNADSDFDVNDLFNHNHDLFCLNFLDIPLQSLGWVGMLA